MTKKNAKKNAARARQDQHGGHYQAHMRTVEEDPRCGGCHRPISLSQEKCECGWILRGDALECLERDDLLPRQRYAIELELEAVAKTGPRAPGESPQDYSLRVQQTLRDLIAQTAFDADDELAFDVDLPRDD